MRGDMSKAGPSQGIVGKPADCDEATGRRPAGSALREHMRLMCDVAALAIQTDNVHPHRHDADVPRPSPGYFYPFLN